MEHSRLAKASVENIIIISTKKQGTENLVLATAFTFANIIQCVS